MDLEHTGAFERLSALPAEGVIPESFERVVVDWPALTFPEKVVVLAATRPLARLAPFTGRERVVDAANATSRPRSRR